MIKVLKIFAELFEKICLFPDKCGNVSPSMEFEMKQGKIRMYLFIC